MIQLRLNGTTQSIDGAPEGSKPIRKGRAMTQDKTQHHVTFASGILLLFFVGLTFFVVSIVRAAPGPDSAASAAAFRTKCVMCHGPDGSGSAIGKSMNVSGLALTGSPETAQCATGANHFRRQRGNAFLQEFA
jgi:cytochrome c553